MTITNAKLIDALILERARVLYLLSLTGNGDADLDTADILLHVERARHDVERQLVAMRSLGRKDKLL